MKDRMQYGWVAIALLLAPSANAANLAVTLGTSGVSADWSVPVSERVQTRFHGSFLSVEVDQTQDDIDYQVEFNNSQMGVLVDWHPFAGGLRLSTGLVLSDFGTLLEADYQNDSVEIGDNTYDGTLFLDGDVKFNRVAPYAGFGWASTPTERGLSFVADIGAIMIGKGTLDLDAGGQVKVAGTSTQPIDVANFAEFQRDLEIERQKAEKDIQDFRLFPVLNFGMSYGF